jgi:WD40 repeat protein
VWDAEDGHKLLDLHGQRDSGGGVAWSPDGKRLATVSSDGIVQVYTMDIRDLMEVARQHVRALTSEEEGECLRYFQVEECPPVPNLPWW